MIANIHAGEVEGKEAVQVLLREIAMGEHEALLHKMTVTFLPVYNGDGNERFGKKNRPGQNGPDAVGVRHNGQNLDLNRDFVKAEAPETKVAAGAVQPARSAPVHGPAHDQRVLPRLPPDLLPCRCRRTARPASPRHRANCWRTRARRWHRRHALNVFDYGNFPGFDGARAPKPSGACGRAPGLTP